MKIKQPEIIDFTNTNHDHSSSVSGGTISWSNISNTNVNGQIPFYSGTTFSGDTSINWDNKNDILKLGSGATTLTLDQTKILMNTKTSNTSLSVDVQNLSNGISGSTDFIANADNATDTTNYIDLGINSSGYADVNHSINDALGGYLYNVGGDLSIGTATPSKNIKLHTGGNTSSNLRATISDTGITSNIPITISSTLDASIGSNLITSDSDSGVGVINNWSGTSWSTISTFSGKTTGSLTNVSVNSTNKTYTRTNGSFINDGFAVGQIITWSGFTNNGNNISTFAISTLTATIMTLTGATGLVTEISGATVNCTLLTCKLANVSVNATGKTYTRTSGSWITDGFVVGQTPNITGFTNNGNNISTFAISTLTATIMTLTGATGLVNESSGSTTTFTPYAFVHTAGSTAPATLSGYTSTIGNIYQISLNITTTTVGTLTISYGGVIAGISNIAGTVGRDISTLIGFTNVVTTTTTAGLVLTPSSAWIGYVTVAKIIQLTPSSPTITLKNASGSISIEGRGSDTDSFGFGLNSLELNTVGNGNIAYGPNSLACSTVIGFNTAIGNEAMRYNTTGDHNTAIGMRALANGVSGAYNTALGYASLYSTNTGIQNTGIGGNALGNNASGSYNTAVGRWASNNNITGSYNTIIGNEALYNQTANSHCIAIGYAAGHNTTLDNKLFIDTYNRVNQAGDLAGAIITGTMDLTPENQVLTFNAATTSIISHTTPIINGSISNSGTLTIRSTTGATKATAGILMDENISSTSKTTGTLVVSGGVGIGGSTFIGGTLNVTGNTILNGSLNTTGNTSIVGTLNVTGQTNLTNVFLNSINGLPVSGVSGQVLFYSGATFSGDTSINWDNTNKVLKVGNGTPTFTVDNDHALIASKTSNIYFSIDVQNLSNSVSGSTDFIANADNATDTTNYIDLGINSSTYTDTSFNINGALGGYLYNVGGDLSIGTSTINKVIKFHTDGTILSNLRATISNSGLTLNGALNTTGNTTLNGTLNVTGNTFTNNIINGYATTATANATTFLTSSSPKVQFFTGTLYQAVNLPSATTLTLGFDYYIHNNSTASIALYSVGTNYITNVAPNSYCVVTCISTVGTTQTSWSYKLMLLETVVETFTRSSINNVNIFPGVGGSDGNWTSYGTYFTPKQTMQFSAASTMNAILCANTTGYYIIAVYKYAATNMTLMFATPSTALGGAIANLSANVTNITNGVLVPGTTYYFVFMTNANPGMAGLSLGGTLALKPYRNFSQMLGNLGTGAAGVAPATIAEPTVESNNGTIFMQAII